MSATVSVKFTITNVEADGYDYGTAARAILETIAQKAEDGRTGGHVLDGNGNTIGKWSIR